MTYLLTKDGSLKSILLEQYSDAAWNFATGAPETSDNALYGLVAPVFRAINLTANVCAEIPWALVNKAGEDVDITTKWENVVGFMPYPADIFRRWFISILMTNTAYGFMEQAKGIKRLMYISPATMSAKVESGTAAAGYADAGLMGFTRAIGTQSTYYPLDSRRIVYIWRRDHTTEIMPSKNTAFRAMASAAGILRYADYFIENYFSSGGVKPAIIGVKGVSVQGAKEQAETAWDKFVKMVDKLRVKVYNADAVSITPFGDGVGDLQNTNTFSEQCEKIAMATGMPLSILKGQDDNYASAQVYSTSWFRYDIMPLVNWLAQILTEQLFQPLGLRMEYRPEMTDEGTSDQVNRASAYATYVSAGMKPSLAAQICGLELPNDMPFETLDPPPAPAPVPAPATETPAPEYSEPTQAAPEPPPAKFVPSVDQLREMQLWETFAFRALKKSRSLVTLKFDVKTLPAEIADNIRLRLGYANSEDDIRAVFALDDLPAPPVDDGIHELAKSLNALADAYKATITQ